MVTDREIDRLREMYKIGLELFDEVDDPLLVGDINVIMALLADKLRLLDPFNFKEYCCIFDRDFEWVLESRNGT